MPVLPQQRVGILAGSSLVAVLTEVAHQEVGLLLVVSSSEQALQQHWCCSAVAGLFEAPRSVYIGVRPCSTTMPAMLWSPLQTCTMIRSMLRGNLGHVAS